MLCGKTPSWSIMSTLPDLLGLARRPCSGADVEADDLAAVGAVPEQVALDERLEQMPSPGQSLTRPAASLGLYVLPEELAGLLVEATSTPRVAVVDTVGSYLASLLVPTKTMPLAMTGLP